MTTTTTTPPPTLLDRRDADLRMLDRSPRASHKPASARVCGGGVAQPGWAACHAAGTWEVSRPWGGTYTHAYCATHAAARIRCDDRWNLQAATTRGGAR